MRIGGTPNHIHILCAIAKNIAISTIIEEIKTSSSKWIKTKNPKYKEFYWQAGYGAFSVSVSMKNTICDYIDNQPQHHQKMSFIEEFKVLLQRHDLEIDDRYPID